jgi:hypothetical protein
MSGLPNRGFFAQLGGSLYSTLGDGTSDQTTCFAKQAGGLPNPTLTSSAIDLIPGDINGGGPENTLRLKRKVH